MSHPVILREMSTQAKEIMSRELLTAFKNSTVEEVLKLFMHHRITGVPVVDANGKMIGVCSEYDVIRQVAKAKKNHEGLYQKPIQFSRKVEAVKETMPLKDVVRRFVNKKFRRLPVIDSKGKLVGIITRRDLMRIFYYQARLPEDG